MRTMWAMILPGKRLWQGQRHGTNRESGHDPPCSVIHGQKEGPDLWAPEPTRIEADQQFCLFPWLKQVLGRPTKVGASRFTQRSDSQRRVARVDDTKRVTGLCPSDHRAEVVVETIRKHHERLRRRLSRRRHAGGAREA